jgi:hypothetical protein
VGTDLLGEETGEARFAGPGRAPQQGRAEVTTGDASAQRTAFADEMLLADELSEAPGSHPGGQRLALGWWLEQGLGAGAA